MTVRAGNGQAIDGAGEDVPLPPYRPLAEEEQEATTPMWLSHHWPGDEDRCARIGQRHVCRRCLFMYPVAAVAAVLSAVGWFWPRRLDGAALWLLPAPAVADFVADNLGLARYSARRQAVLSAIGALAAGVVTSATSSSRPTPTRGRSSSSTVPPAWPLRSPSRDAAGVTSPRRAPEPQHHRGGPPPLTGRLGGR